MYYVYRLPDNIRVESGIFFLVPTCRVAGDKIYRYSFRIFDGNIIRYFWCIRYLLGNLYKITMVGSNTSSTDNIMNDES